MLTAAEQHGATPYQDVMEFQVGTAKRLPMIHAGCNLIILYFRKNMEAVTAGIEDRKTDTGTMKISSAALTALDRLRYPQAFGVIDNVTTVLSRTSDRRSIPNNSPPFRRRWSDQSCNASSIC